MTNVGTHRRFGQAGGYVLYTCVVYISGINVPSLVSKLTAPLHDLHYFRHE